MEGNSSQLETRVARLETHMEHMDSNITRIMADLHDLRTSTEARFEAVNQKFDQKFEAANEKIDKKFAAVNERFDRMNDRISMLHVTMNEKFSDMNEKLGDINAKFGGIDAKFGEIKVWALTILGGGLGFGILTVIARALHWI